MKQFYFNSFFLLGIGSLGTGIIMKAGVSSSLLWSGISLVIGVLILSLMDYSTTVEVNREEAKKQLLSQFNKSFEWNNREHRLEEKKHNYHI